MSATLKLLEVEHKPFYLNREELVGLTLTFVIAFQELSLLLSTLVDAEFFQDSPAKKGIDILGFSIENIISDVDAVIMFYIAFLSFNLALVVSLNIIQRDLTIWPSFSCDLFSGCPYLMPILALVSLLGSFSFILAVTLTFSNEQDEDVQDADEQEERFMKTLAAAVVIFWFLVSFSVGKRCFFRSVPTNLPARKPFFQTSTSRDTSTYVEKLLVESFISVSYVPLLAMLTSTVVTDNQVLLAFTIVMVVVMSFVRLNLAFSVPNLETGNKKIKTSAPRYSLATSNLRTCCKFTECSRCSCLLESGLSVRACLDGILYCRCTPQSLPVLDPVKTGIFGPKYKNLELFIQLLPFFLLLPFIVTSGFTRDVEEYYANVSGSFVPEEAPKEAATLVLGTGLAAYIFFTLVMLIATWCGSRKISCAGLSPYGDNKKTRLTINLILFVLKVLTVIIALHMVVTDNLDDEALGVILQVLIYVILGFYAVLIFLLGYFHQACCFVFADLFCFAEDSNQPKYSVLLEDGNEELFRKYNTNFVTSYASWKANVTTLSDKLLVIMNMYKALRKKDGDNAEGHKISRDPLSELLFRLRSFVPFTYRSRDFFDFSDSNYLSLVDLLEMNLDETAVTTLFFYKERNITGITGDLFHKCCTSVFKHVVRFQFAFCSFDDDGFSRIVQLFKDRLQRIEHLTFVSCSLNKAQLKTLEDCLKDGNFDALVAFGVINNQDKNFIEIT